MSPAALSFGATWFFEQATGAKQGVHATILACMTKNTMRLGGQMRLPLLYKTAGVVALAYSPSASVRSWSTWLSVVQGCRDER